MAALLSAGVTRSAGALRPRVTEYALPPQIPPHRRPDFCRQRCPRSDHRSYLLQGVYRGQRRISEKLLRYRAGCRCLSDGSFAAQLTDDGPQVLIVHSHGSEASHHARRTGIHPTGSFRTDNDACNVVRVGDEIAAALSERGISVLHDRTLHDVPDYNDAYPPTVWLPWRITWRNTLSGVRAGCPPGRRLRRRRRNQYKLVSAEGAPRRPDEFYYGQRLRRLAGESEAGHSHSAEPQRRLSYPHVAYYGAELPL